MQVQRDFSIGYHSNWEVLCAIIYINKVLSMEGEYLEEFENIRDIIFEGNDYDAIEALKSTKEYYSQIYFENRKN